MRRWCKDRRRILKTYGRKCNKKEEEENATAIERRMEKGEKHNKQKRDSGRNAAKYYKGLGYASNKIA